MEASGRDGEQDDTAGASEPAAGSDGGDRGALREKIASLGRKVHALHKVNYDAGQGYAQGLRDVLALLEDDPPASARWKPTQGEEFCFITPAGYVYRDHYSEKTHEDYWAFGNCFKTCEDAEDARDQLTATFAHFHEAHGT